MKAKLALILSLFLLPCCAEIQEDLKSIPNHILDSFFTRAILWDNADSELDIPKARAESKKEDPEGSIFEWQYIGSLQGDMHIVRFYSWEVYCAGKFTGLLVLKSHGNMLKITDVIASGNRHSSMILEEDCVILNNAVQFKQCLTIPDFIDHALKLYPELMVAYEKSSKKNFCYGEAGFAGVQIKYAAEINTAGRVSGLNVMGFVNSNENPQDLKEFALEFLVDHEVD